MRQGALQENVQLLFFAENGVFISGARERSAKRPQTGLANGRSSLEQAPELASRSRRISGWRNKAGSYRPPQGSPRRTGAPVNRDLQSLHGSISRGPGRFERSGKHFCFHKRKSLEIDLLINNAGFGQYGEFHAVETKRLLEMVQVNCHAVVHLTRFTCQRWSRAVEAIF